MMSTEAITGGHRRAIPGPTRRPVLPLVIAVVLVVVMILYWLGSSIRSVPLLASRRAWASCVGSVRGLRAWAQCLGITALAPLAVPTVTCGRVPRA